MNGEQMRILAIDDNDIRRQNLGASLATRGFSLMEASGMRSAEQLLKKEAADLCILINSVQEGGNKEEICRLRKIKSGMPVILMATESSRDERITAFRAGADEFITGDICFDELSARIEAIMRRVRGQGSTVIVNSRCQLDTSARQLLVSGSPAELTCFEYRIIEMLIKNCGKIVSRERLMAALYAEPALHNQDVISVIISRLRKKMMSVPECRIVAIRREGYCFRASAE